jgi:hypothetical protein
LALMDDSPSPMQRARGPAGVGPGAALRRLCGVLVPSNWREGMLAEALAAEAEAAKAAGEGGTP